MIGKRTLVIGGSIGGLAAATAQKGFEITVIERSDGSDVEGVGISQQANVVRGLAGLGLAPGLPRRGLRLRRGGDLRPERRACRARRRLC
jgi:2-polyprenyl-6-methoxyphenol hydroxylase-like FAD-dependent oxidoreductase